MNKRGFIDSITDGALKGRADYGILPSLTIAQAILESGWGSSELSKAANNLFGIKATSDWAGRRTVLSTGEWYDNQMKIVDAAFRSYSSFNESIEDHNKLLSYSRYMPVRRCRDYKEACHKVFECGYATDPEYSDKLIRIIEENRLYEFDSQNVLLEPAISIESEKIRKFQQLCNRLNIRDDDGQELAEDNILGPRTRSCILKMPMLMQGSKGPAVEFIQRIVGAEPVDGDFGPITKQCVMEYQRKYGLEVDGIVGPQTWTAVVRQGDASLVSQ